MTILLLFFLKSLLPDDKTITNYSKQWLISTSFSSLSSNTDKSVDEWLPSVHIAICNFLLSTFRSVIDGYLQEDLGEFYYRFNRWFVEKEIPNRLQ